MSSNEVTIKVVIKIGDSTIELDQSLDLNRVKIFKDTHPVLREHIQGIVDVIKSIKGGDA